MNNDVFMGCFLRSISDGDFFKKVFAIILRVLAIVIALGGLYVWIRLWGAVFDLRGFFGVVSGIIFQLILIVTIAMVVHVIWLRAGTINSLVKAEFTVIPIASILMKMMGELYVSIFVPLSIAGGIGIWLGGGDLTYFIKRYLVFLPELPFDFLSYGGGFLGGLSFIIGGIVAAFLSLVFFYLLAEMLVVTVDIAKNIKTTREIAEGHRKGESI